MNKKENSKKSFSEKKSNKLPESLLPDDTSQALRGKKADNISLLLNKMVWTDGEKLYFYKKNENNEVLKDITQDIKDMLEITKKKKEQKKDNLLVDNSYNNVVGSFLNRHKISLNTLNNLTSRSFVFTPEWRLIVGIGNESIYETSMTLHYIYGIPFIPGQAVKGVVRSWVITEIFKPLVDKVDSNRVDGKPNKKDIAKKKDRYEEEALQDELFCKIFGCPKKSALKETYQGSIYFFDALPKEVPKIELDIMNPHYSKYYQGELPPADYIDPVPVSFLTVKNTPYEFSIGVKQNREFVLSAQDKQSLVFKFIEGELINGFTLMDIAAVWLKKALTDHGIGAKTAAGYGYMHGR